MNRDMDLVRHILFAIENSPDDEPASINLEVDGVDDLHLSLHVRLMHEGGLIHAVQSRGFNLAESWTPHSLTWRGHDFLDAIRSDAVWRRVKQKAALIGATLPTDLIYDLAIEEIKAEFSHSAATPSTRSASNIAH